jgi:ABC-type sulfate transport system substrate-binding protein
MGMKTVVISLLTIAALMAPDPSAKVVFVVHKGNPKAIKDWNDLARGGVRVVTPDPKTSDAGKWNYLAAFAYALKQPGGTNARALNFVAGLLRNVPMLAPDAAKAGDAFVRGTGDVLLASDSDARAAVDQSRNSAEIIVPSISTVNVDELFGGWERAQRTHFSAGGTFDQVYEPGLAK